MLDLQHLRAFVAIADAGGVTRAADRLHVSQPAVSQRIHAMETLLGLSLFERAGRGLRLTTDGEELLRRSRHLLDEADALIARARELKAGESGLIRIGATPPMIETVLSRFLPGWRVRHPTVEVHIAEDGGTSLVERLKNGDVQLAYVPAPSDRLEGHLLFPIHVVAVVQRSHPLARREIAEIDALAGEPLMALRRGFGSREWFESACMLANIHPRFVLESASHSAVIELVAAGYGVGILPSAATPLRSGLSAVPICHRGTPIGRWTMLAWAPGRALASYVRSFADELAAHARSNFPGRRVVQRAPAIREPRLTPGRS